MALCQLSASSFPARAQNALGKHPADKVLPAFFSGTNANANAIIQGLNQYGTLPGTNATVFGTAAGSNPNAVTNNDSRALTFTNLTNPLLVSTAGNTLTPIYTNVVGAWSINVDNNSEPGLHIIGADTYNGSFFSDGGSGFVIRGAGTFQGNAANATNLNAASLATGTIANARLSTAVVTNALATNAALPSILANTLFVPTNSGTTYGNDGGGAGVVSGSNIGTNVSPAQVVAIMATNSAAGVNLDGSYVAYLDLPTWDGTNIMTHPNLLALRTNWNGAPYWLTYTPLHASREWPHVAFSADLVNWRAASSDGGRICTSQDVWAVTGGAGGGWTSGFWTADPEIFLSTNGVLQVIWYALRDAGTLNQIIMGKSCTNGYDWSSPYLLVSNTANQALFAGPQIVKTPDGGLRLYYVDDDQAFATNSLWYVNGLDGSGTNWNWAVSNLCGLTTFSDNTKTPWHFDMEYVGNTNAGNGGKYIMIHGAQDLNAGEYADSSDGINWGNVRGGVFNAVEHWGRSGTNTRGVYKPTLVTRPGPDGNPLFDFILGMMDADGVNMDNQNVNGWKIRLLRGVSLAENKVNLAAAADTNQTVIGCSGLNANDPAYNFRVGRLSVWDKIGGIRFGVGLGTPGAGYGAVNLSGTTMTFANSAVIGSGVETIINSPTTSSLLWFRQGNSARFYLNAGGNLESTGFSITNVNKLTVTNVANINQILTTNLATFSTVAAATVNATGWTNVWTTNNATVYLTATAVAFTVKNRADATIYTSPVMSQTISVNLQPGWSVNSAAGLSGTALPW